MTPKPTDPKVAAILKELTRFDTPTVCNALEFVYMVEGGMPAMEAIQAATVTTAELLGVRDELGSIVPGKLADIIAVDGDPLEDIAVLQSVSFVMKDGQVFKQP